MGQIRVELMTPALSERCSNQLSYCPKKREIHRDIEEEKVSVRMKADLFWKVFHLPDQRS